MRKSQLNEVEPPPLPPNEVFEGNFQVTGTNGLVPD